MKDLQRLSVSEIIRQMKLLWKKTFGDSDDYINLVFDTYFDIDLVECEIVDGKVIASMMAIPYSFHANILENNIVNNIKLEEFTSLQGLYLCGLATDPEYRKGGIMSKMIEEISVNANRRGYSFLFLIPADSDLVKYYQKRGFIESCYKFKYQFNFINYKSKCNNIIMRDYIIYDSKLSNINNIGNKLLGDGCSFLAELDIKKLLQKYDLSILKKLYLRLYEIEYNDKYNNILHSYNDFVTILKENYISYGSVYILFNDVNIRNNKHENTEKSDYENSLLHYISRGVLADKELSNQVYINESAALHNLIISSEPAAIVFCSNSCKEDALHIQRILCDSEESEETLLYLLKSLNTTKTHINWVSPTPVNCIENLFAPFLKAKNKALTDSDSNEERSKLDCLKINELTADLDTSIASNNSGSQNAEMTRFSTRDRLVNRLSDMGITSITRSIEPTAMVRVLNPAEIEKIVDSCTDTRKFCNFSSSEADLSGGPQQSTSGTAVIERKFASLINASLLLE